MSEHLSDIPQLVDGPGCSRKPVRAVFLKELQPGPRPQPLENILNDPRYLETLKEGHSE